MLVTCSIGRTSHQSLILYTVARLDTRWRDIEDGNGLPVTHMAQINVGVHVRLKVLVDSVSSAPFLDCCMHLETCQTYSPLTIRLTVVAVKAMIDGASSPSLKYSGNSSVIELRGSSNRRCLMTSTIAGCSNGLCPITIPCIYVEQR